MTESESIYYGSNMQTIWKFALWRLFR